MAAFSQHSINDLRARRQLLRRQRRRRRWQQLWRQTVLLGLAAGSLWLATSSRWQLQSASQIRLTGNQLLADQAVHELLALDYPQSLLEVHPLRLERQLVTGGPIADAVVQRRLLPPGLDVRIQERRPVAIALPNVERVVANLEASDHFSQKGFLDAQGYWMPYSSFTSASSIPKPVLQIVGMRPVYQQHWPEVYRAIQNSPVAITSLDWRDPTDITLQTDLGTVRIGAYGPIFSQQLATLDQIRNLNEKLNSKEIALIDVRNPDNPTLEILQANKSIQP